MEEYIVIKNTNEEIIYTSNIDEYIDNSNYHYDLCCNVLHYPLGCYFKYDCNMCNNFYYNSNTYLVDEQRCMECVRKQRDNYLIQTDIYTLPDRIPEHYNELIEYRQYLRELPNEIEKVGIDEYYGIHNKRKSLVEKFDHLTLKDI